MKRKGRYTYVPKDEIAEVRTFNDVSFETDDLLDGAYVKGRKKYARGGMPSKRPMSLEEQAAESVGYDTWYMMDAVDQKELVGELVSTGMIAPMFGWGGKMADGGKVLVGKFDEKQLRNGEDKKAIDKKMKETGLKYIDSKIIKKNGKPHMMEVYLYADGGMMADGGEVKKIVTDRDGTFYLTYIDPTHFYLSNSDDFKGNAYHIGEFRSRPFYKEVKDWLDNKGVSPEYLSGKRGELNSYSDAKIARIYANMNDLDFNDVLIELKDNREERKYIIEEILKEVVKRGNPNYADGGELTEKQSAIDEALKIAQFAYENDITASGNSIEEFSNKIFDLSGISYAKAYLGLAYQAMKNQGYADGGVTGSTYVVKYSKKDTPEIVKEKIFTDKDSAELFHETIFDNEDLVVMDLQEIKASPAPAPKKSLFATAKPAPATTAAAKKKRERVQVDGIADEIARYDALKATINNAKAEQEVIGGRLKEIGREKFLDLYEQRGVRPANFDLADGSENILLEVTDKYLKVEPEKAEILRQFGGLLEEKTTYEFDSEILEKEVSDGMTIGDVVSMLIQDSKLIPDSDKANLIKAKMSMRVPKGTLDRLMDYDNPREVFSLISPILALK
jgi:hypothetical protein